MNINDLPDNLTPKILSETDDYLVISKPAGLTVHPGSGATGYFLTDWLVKKWPKMAMVGEDPARPGIVHRLDKDVSGLMVVAKNNDCFFHLKEQFRIRSVKKHYQALVHGRIVSDYGTISFPITRSKDGHKMAALPANSSDLLTRRQPRQRDQGNVKSWFKSREASTEFHVIKKFVNFTLLKIEIKTGRTHQIRVHFFAYGHPLVGDNLYCTKKTKEKNEKLDLGRVWLVADFLKFQDRKNREVEFKIDLPEDLKRSLPKN